MPITNEQKNKHNALTNNQNDKLFKRGKAISGAPINKGINQFPKPPIKIGITIKKIIIIACDVTIVLYKCASPLKNKLPGWANSQRIINEKFVPMTPEKAPKIKYNVPISLWLVAQNLR
jgi:hypothetical protein